MATDDESYLELFDVSKKAQIAKVPLASIRFLPRIGERIFLPLDGPGDWDSYTVVAVEYFLGYDPSTGQPRSPSAGMGRVTLTLKNQSRADFVKADRLVWAYNLIWIFVLDGIRLITERFATYRTARRIESQKW